MSDSISLRARKMREHDLGDVLEWRNHPEVRRFMLTQHEITASEHRRWFDSASNNPSHELLIIETYDQPLGCVIFSGNKDAATFDWSFYTVPSSPAGTGKAICMTALDYIFDERGAHKVVGRVLDFNKASVRIHELMGFILEGTLHGQRLINGESHDLLCYGLKADEWRRYGD